MTDTPTVPAHPEPPELTRTYTVDQLEQIGVPYEDAVIDCREHSDHRWYTVYRCTFLDPADDTAWSVLRADPATERQENDWWIQYADRNAIPCERMELVTVTRKEWHVATAPQEWRDLAEGGC